MITTAKKLNFAEFLEQRPEDGIYELVRRRDCSSRAN